MPLVRIVPGPEELARDTCQNFLTAPQLREVCRARGFAVPGTKKADLADGVASRFLGTVGVAEAMAALPVEGLHLIHAIAASESPPGLRELLPVVAPGVAPWQADYRSLFARVAQRVLQYGVALVRDGGTFAGAGRSRFENVSFVLPKAFHSLLPPFPVRTSPFSGPTIGDGVDIFARRAIVRAAAGETSGDDLLARVAGGIRFSDGILSIADTALDSPDSLVAHIRRQWLLMPTGPGSRDAKGVLRVAAHVLSTLPKGDGVTRSALCGVAERWTGNASAQAIDRLLSEGLQAGLLLAVGNEGSRLWRAAPAGQPRNEPLRFVACEDGAMVDVPASGLASLCAAAAFSLVTPREGRLHLAPDPLRLGRLADRIDDSLELELLAGGSPVFASAVRTVRGRRGKTHLHVGLTVLRVEDSLLLATITHRFGRSVRRLGGPWIAVQPQALPGILAAAAKEGYHPRRGT